jgi:hypothetical protein
MGAGGAGPGARLASSILAGLSTAAGIAPNLAARKASPRFNSEHLEIMKMPAGLDDQGFYRMRNGDTCARTAAGGRRVQHRRVARFGRFSHRRIFYADPSSMPRVATARIATIKPRAARIVVTRTCCSEAENARQAQISSGRISFG